MKTYRRWMGSSIAAAALLAGCGGDSSGPTVPVIVTEPADQVAHEGDTASFSFQAIGMDPLEIQWLSGSAPVNGASASTLSLPTVALASSGTRYSATVTNLLASAATREALLTVSPRTWSSAPVVPAVGSEPVAQASAAVADAQGHVTVAFQGPGGTASRPAMWVGRITAGSTTPLVTDISTPAVPANTTSEEPRIAVDASGRTMIVWHAQEAGSAAVSVYAAMKAWGAGPDMPAVRLSAPDVMARNPDVAAVADGVFEVVWREMATNASVHDVVARRFSASSGSWAAQQTLDNAPDEVDVPRIAADGAGRVWAVWATTTPAPSTAQIVGVERTASQSAWNPNAVVVLDGTTTPDFFYAPQIRLDANGHGALAFHDLTGRVYVSRLDGGAWTAPQYVANWAENTEPAIALHAATGRIAIASLAAGTGASQLYHWDYDPAAGWSTPYVVRTVTPDLQIRQPQIGFDAAGNAVVAWIESTGETGNGSILRARRRMAGALGWLADVPVVSDPLTPGETNRLPSFAVAPDGSALAFWNRFLFGNAGADSTWRLSLLR